MVEVVRAGHAWQTLVYILRNREWPAPQRAASARAGSWAPPPTAPTFAVAPSLAVGTQDVLLAWKAAGFCS